MVYDSNTLEVLHRLTEEGLIEYQKMLEKRDSSVWRNIVDMIKSKFEKTNTTKIAKEST